MTEYLYTEDKIKDLTEQIKNLKGKILLDDHNELYILKDYDIKSTTVNEWNGFFKPKKEQFVFYINSLTLLGKYEEHIHQDDVMCSKHGVQTLMNYHANYTRLQINLIKFGVKNDITLRIS